jgi:DNA damage-binding protein 1
VKPLVFGGLDGIITTFAVVAGAIGAQFSMTQVLIMGFANLLADAFSMGLGEYISSKAELEFTENEYKRETWEFEHHPEGELKEMVDIYVKKGISEEDACVILSTLSKYKEPFVDHMMVEELGLMPPDVDENPLKQGLVMFCAFVLFGALPLTGLVAVMSIVGKDDAGDYQNLAFGLSCGLTAITLMCLGAVKARYTKQSMVKSALLMLMNGTISGGAAFAVGEGLNHFFG